MNVVVLEIHSTEKVSSLVSQVAEKWTPIIAAGHVISLLADSSHESGVRFVDISLSFVRYMHVEYRTNTTPNAEPIEFVRGCQLKSEESCPINL